MEKTKEERLIKIFDQYEIYNETGTLYPLLETEMGSELYDEVVKYSDLQTSSRDERIKVLEAEVEKYSGKLLETERELYLTEQDSRMLDWLQSKMTPADSYCEIFFAGLRDGHNDAESFQIESNPERFKTMNAPTVREVIIKAMTT